MPPAPTAKARATRKAWLILLAAVPIVVFILRSDSHPRESVKPEELQALLASPGTIQLIDVRSPEEHAAGHIAGDTLIPLSSLTVRIAEIDKSKPVVFYCRSGNRSGKALDSVATAGLTAPKHLAGGINAWMEAGLPVVK